MTSHTHPPYLSNLREATRPLHDETETLVDSFRLLEGDLTHGHYLRLLLTHYAFHQEVRFHMQAYLGKTILDWPDCARIKALEKDIVQMGAALPTALGPTYPPESAAFSMGLCYVSEGSCLGNQQLYKAVKDHPSFVAWEADHFYRSCKEGLSARWKSFLESLAHHGEDHYPELEQGAVTGFRYFGILWERFATLEIGR